MQANQSNSSFSTLSLCMKGLNISQQTILHKAHAIEITKACTVASMKARNYFIVRCREKHACQLGKKQKMALDNRFWLTWKSYLWFNKVVHGQPSIKRTL